MRSPHPPGPHVHYCLSVPGGLYHIFLSEDDLFSYQAEHGGKYDRHSALDRHPVDDATCPLSEAWPDDTVWHGPGGLAVRGNAWTTGPRRRSQRCDRCGGEHSNAAQVRRCYGPPGPAA